MKAITKMMLLAGFVASCTASSATYASVAAYQENWGQHDVIEGAGRLVTGSFTDIFTFNLTSPASLTAVAVANNNGSWLSLSSGWVELFNGIYGDAFTDVSKGSFSFNGTTGSSANLMNNLAAGGYFYQVTGNGSGSFGGAYMLTSAVPEAETWAMMAVGLGLIGLQLRRRRSGTGKISIN